MTTYFQSIAGDIESRWEIDRTAAAAVAAWAARAPALLERDLASMAAYFPTWLLIGSQGGKPVRCATCHLPCAPTAGAIRCIRCGLARRAQGLLWMGNIPAAARIEPAFARRRAALREAGFAEVQAGGSAYILVPLSVAYPAEWPNLEPVARYAGSWLDALGLPRASAAHHLIENGRACLFAWGQWSAMPIHAVLQQRVVNHIASLLKIAAGQPPASAFIGRIHHDDWQPEQ